MHLTSVERYLKSRKLYSNYFAGVAQAGRRAALRTLLLEVQVLSPAFGVCRHGANWQTRQSQKLHCEGSSPSACIIESLWVWRNSGRRTGLRSRLLEVQVLSPTSDFRRRSSIGRARVCQARGREFKPPRRLHILLHAWPSGLQAQGRSPCQGGSIPSACFI